MASPRCGAQHVAGRQQALEFDYPAKIGGSASSLLIDDRCGPVRAGSHAAGAATKIPRVPQRSALDATFSRRPQRCGSKKSSEMSTRRRTSDVARDGDGRSGVRRSDPPLNKTAIKRGQSAAMSEVAEDLGNTPAVARNSYVDPRVVEGYELRPDHRGGRAAGGRAPRRRASGRRSWRTAPRG